MLTNALRNYVDRTKMDSKKLETRHALASSSAIQSRVPELSFNYCKRYRHAQGELTSVVSNIELFDTRSISL